MKLLLKLIHLMWLATLLMLFSLTLATTALGQSQFSHDPSGNLTNIAASTSAPSATSFGGTQTITVSNQLSLSVMGSGSGVLTYQWQLNGTNIVGATDATFFRPNAATTDAGNYSVVISNSYGSVTSQVGTVTVLSSADTLYALAKGLGRYVAVGDKGTIVSSPDLIVWGTASSGTTNRLESITFTNNLFVAVGAKGTILNSTNGIDWTAVTSGNSNDLKSITYGNSLFVAVGWGGTTMTSTNGANWITQSYDDPKLESVAYGTNRFVAVGRNGTIWVSTNAAATWADRSYSTDVILSSVIFANGGFVAVGAGGLVLTSPDGETWTTVTSNISRDLETLHYFNNTFFALGPSANGYISSSASSWGSIVTGTYDGLYGAASGSNTLIAVGQNGTIVQIPVQVLEHFEWLTIPSPQRVSNAFPVTIVAKDAANNTLSNFSGSVTLSARADTITVSTNLLGGVSHTLAGANSTNTIGYLFTPNKDLLVTHVRYYSGKNVSIWTDAGTLLARVNVTSTPGTWNESPLGAPLTLSAGKTYVVSVYNEGNYYFRGLMSPVFADGTINQGLSIGSDNFPGFATTNQWPFVDLRYEATRSQSVAITPVAVYLANGTASTNITITNVATNVVLQATHESEASGTSAPFDVLSSADISIAVSASPAPAAVLTNLTYTVRVMNAGPEQATGVFVTNTLPANASYVSATPSQGSCSVAGGIVTCNLGTMAGLTNAAVTIVVTPTVAGAWLTNRAVVRRDQSETNQSNNSATLATYVAPALFASNVAMNEGNVGYSTASFTLHLSGASPLTVFFDTETQDGSSATANAAVSGNDYEATSGTDFFFPGETQRVVNVSVKGDTVTEPTESFSLRIYNVLNATLTNSQTPACVITNDDGLSGSIDHLVWNTILSPQRIGQSFSTTITAKDSANATVTGFTGAAKLYGLNLSRATNALLSSESYNAVQNNGSYTLGYQFTPTNNIFLTHFRVFSGTKVSLWTDKGFLLASLAVTNSGGAWVDLPVATPILLSASNNYRVSFLSGGDNYYSQWDHPASFAGGTIGQSYYSAGDEFPSVLDGSRWYLVDIRYALPSTVTPSVSGNFVSGVWNGNVTVLEVATNFTVLADDSDGHLGYANSFGIYPTNDLALTIATTPALPLVGSNLTYTLTVLNSGPNSSTGVKLTNTLPADATFISATPSQGSCTLSGGVLSCDLGTIANLSTAAVSVTVVPIVAGASLTNSAIVTRTESGDPDPTNNFVSFVLVANYAHVVLLAEGLDILGASWRSGGDGLWFFQTNTVHDGLDAVQSGSISDGKESWLEITLRGPATFNFWWKISSETNGDTLTFTANGSTQATISGNVDWTQRSYQLSSGLTTLRWTYQKNALISAGADAAWLDQAVQSVPTFSISSPTVLTNGHFQFSLLGTNGQQLVIQASTNLATWSSVSTNIVTTNGTSIYTDTQATNHVYRFYRAIHRND